MFPVDLNVFEVWPVRTLEPVAMAQVHKLEPHVIVVIFLELDSANFNDHHTLPVIQVSCFALWCACTVIRSILDLYRIPVYQFALEASQIAPKDE